jgi:D-sedoheptulose 7-phosphate isomerase
MKSTGYFANYSDAVHRALDQALVTEGSVSLDVEAGFERAVAMTKQIKAAGNTLYFCGNGASAAMASHMALDWMKAGGVRALCFNDSAALTAFGNDIGYPQVFEFPLQSLGRPGDVLVTISSSGNSPNVIAALKRARAMGIVSITFSGFSAENASRAAGDLNFYVPCRTYGVAECAHQLMLHAWLDKYLEITEWHSN